jgi:N-acetylglutamate synthase-like GNAT family acetyltransferase
MDSAGKDQMAEQDGFASFHIRSCRPDDRQAVIDLILSIQRDEYGMTITAQDQPDLSDIGNFYQTGAGAFLVAESSGTIVGTIAMKDIGAKQVALRKMFVAADWRGRDMGVAQSLLDALIEQARQSGVKRMLLGTADHFRAAHRFYERNCFARVAAEDLPTSFPRMSVDTRFYQLTLR